MAHSLRSLLLAFAVVGFAIPAAAGSILGTTGRTCYPTTYSSSNRSDISVFGDWIETIDHANAPAGVSVTIVDKFNGLQHNTSPFQGRGMVTLTIVTSNAAPGNKTITLVGGVFGSATFNITVVGAPTFGNPTVPVPVDPFSDITVTLNGTGLQDAIDPASGTVVKNDPLVPFITVGGDVSVSSVRVLSTSNTSIQARIFFTALVQDVSVDLHFHSGNECVPLGSNLGSATLNDFKTRVRVKSSNQKNFVASVTFPNGRVFDLNSVGTININLLYPSPAGNPTKVFFKFVPANAFERVPNGTNINPTGFTTVEAAPGENIIPITFKVVDCLGGRIGTENSVELQTWTNDTNTNLPPNFVSTTFSVRCK